jgi:predicted phosphoribosyltransferase
MTDLNRNQKNAIDALLRSPSVASAARICGLSERTLWRYLDDEDFSRELRARQEDVLQATATALVGLSQEAIETIQVIMTDDKIHPGTRLRAATNALKLMRDVVELDELAERVAALEEALA